MENSNCPVIFNTKSKIWENSNDINDELMVLNLGEIILKTLNGFNSNKIIEINTNTGIKTTASEMKTLTINFTLNLQRLGIKKGDIIVIFSSMNQFTTPLIYACLIIGAIFVPLETLYTNDIIQSIFEMVNPSVIAYEAIYHERLTKIKDSLNISNLKYFFSFESREDKNSIRQALYEHQHSVDIIKNFNGLNLGNPEEIIGAYVLTSGTTGIPKLMVHSHTHLGLGATTYWNVKNNSIVYVASPLRWISQISSILQPILQQCTRLYATSSPTPQLCAEAIQKYKVTHFFSVSTFMKQILEYVVQINGNHIDSLEAILTGGERISKKILNIISNLNEKCFVIQCYGMTEMAGCIGNNIGTNMKGGYYLCPGLKCKIINENNNNMELISNQNGLICLKAITKFGLYLNNDKANSNSFTKDGWLITGDYGKMDENNQLHVYNRLNDLIKFNGKYIIPTVLETVMDDHHLLDASYIVGIPYHDPTKGEIPVAFCKLNESNFKKSNFNFEEAKEDILKFVNLNLPKDQLPPSHIFFKNDYPYTTCGKVDKLKLQSLAINQI